jgi:hypothetical protein
LSLPVTPESSSRRSGHRGSYGRLFPYLPRFTADDAFLFALGRAGGLSDCQTDVDDERSLGREAAGGSRPDSSSVLNAPSDWQASASLIDLLTCEALVS